MKIAIAGILATFTSATAVMSQAQSCPSYSTHPLDYLYYITGKNSWYIDQLWSKVNALTPKANFFRANEAHMTLVDNELLDDWCVEDGDTVEIFS